MAGVAVGHATVVRGTAVRTGVTVVVPHSGNLFRDKVPASEVQKLDDALAKAKKALEGGNTSEIKTARDELTQASHKLAELMYKQATENEEGPKAPGAEKPNEKKKKDDDVIDADFEEV